MLAKDELGQRGEDLAARHLVGAGFTIVTRNWRCPVGEIDIVALDGDALVVVEVKTRTSTAYGSPAEAITPKKAAKLRQLALTWVGEHPDRGRGIRFDVIGVLIPKQGFPELQHLRGVI